MPGTREHEYKLIEGATKELGLAALEQADGMEYDYESRTWIGWNVAGFAIAPDGKYMFLVSRPHPDMHKG